MISGSARCSSVMVAFRSYLSARIREFRGHFSFLIGLVAALAALGKR